LPIRLELVDFDLEEMLIRAAQEGARRARDEDHGSESPWMGTETAAAYLDTTPDAIRAFEKRGQLRAHRPDGVRLVYYHRNDLDAFARGETS
jgi:hypothetical protein